MKKEKMTIYTVRYTVAGMEGKVNASFRSLGEAKAFRRMVLEHNGGADNIITRTMLKKRAEEALYDTLYVLI